MQLILIIASHDWWYVATTFLLMTMADFSDKLFYQQDCLIGNTNGLLEFEGNMWMLLYPGISNSVLWTILSRAC